MTLVYLNKVDLTTSRYRFILLPPDGTKLDITKLIEHWSLAELDGELCTKLTIKLKNIKDEAFGWLHTKMYLAYRVKVEATFDNQTKEVFSGSFYNFKTVAVDHTIEVVAYPPTYPAVKSVDHFYLPDKQSCKKSIEHIFSAAEVKVKRVDGPNVSLSKKIYKQSAMSACINLLEEAELKGDGDYVPRSNNAEVEVVKTGTNQTVYEITDYTVSSSSDEHSIADDFISEVVIFSNAQGDTRPPVQATKKGDVRFGRFRETIYLSGDDTPSKAIETANEMLKKRNKVEVTRPVKHPDIPFLRKGDKILVASGTIGTMKDNKQASIPCIVESVTRDESGYMTVQLKG